MTAVSFLGVVAVFSLLVLAAVRWCAEHGFHPLRKAFRRFRGLPKLVQLFLVCFLLGYVVYGATKGDGGNTNSPPPMMSAPRRLPQVVPRVITSNDVERGYRVSDGTDGGAIVPMPSGAVTNEPLRLRGGHDWAFRVEPDGWRFPYRDGFLDGVTVLARGEVRPDVGTRYFPIPVTNGVSLLPEARWNLLPDGEASVFSHAVTDEDSLLLDWHNALVGRDPNCPTNIQMELFRDGGFVWRTDGESRSYLPVFPFDWDNDGLENSVDPEPLVANPVDAHNANAEWYGIVCSNVFAATGTTGVSPVDEGLVQFREGVNSNAYYFAEVVAAHGPAPIYFTADRDSDLGSPVVVAHGGVTNRVPLLIGVEYAVTSTVPISVSTPNAEYAVVTTNGERSCSVKWPLKFTVQTSSDGHTVTVTPTPCDPGGTYGWERVEDAHASGSTSQQGGGLPLCTYSANGGCVSFSCTSDTCSCGGCALSGDFLLEGSRSPLPTIWCGCCGNDDVPPEPIPTPHGDMASSPSLSVSFSDPVVIFEDAYTNSPTEVVARQSTETTLTISAYGGPNGAYLLVEPTNVGSKLEKVRGPSLPTTRVKIPANSDVVYEIAYKGKSASESENDIKVRATLTAINEMSPAGITRVMTAVKVELSQRKCAPDIPSCIHRHRFGVHEEVYCSRTPAMTDFKWEVANNDTDDPLQFNLDDTMFWCPFIGGSRIVMAKIGAVVHNIPIDVIEPRIVCTDASWDRHEGVWGNSGDVDMVLHYSVEPRDVSFEGLMIEEVPVESGAFRNDGYFNHVVKRMINNKVWFDHILQN